VWLRIEKSMSPAAIAKLWGWKVNTVRMTQKGFIDRGILALIETKRGGRRRQLMTVEEEKDFLSSFLEKAGKDIVLAANEIKAALERKLGHAVHKTTIYRILHRHGWCKLVPRKSPPKRNKEAAEGFEKGLQRTDSSTEISRTSSKDYVSG
jgi:transposase